MRMIFLEQPAPNADLGRRANALRQHRNPYAVQQQG